jgi:hypothetical protein
MKEFRIANILIFPRVKYSAFIAVARDDKGKSDTNESKILK